MHLMDSRAGVGLGKQDNRQRGEVLDGSQIRDGGLLVAAGDRSHDSVSCHASAALGHERLVAFAVTVVLLLVENVTGRPLRLLVRPAAGF